MTSNVAILSDTNAGTLTPELLWKIDAYWRAARAEFHLRASEPGH
jgi:hypothetical protein